MLKAAYSASAMADELRAADEYFKPFFEGWHDAMARYHGPGWRPDVASKSDASAYDPENFSLEWVSLIASQCVFGNPKVKVKTARKGDFAVDARAHEFALNRWIRDSRMRRLNEKLVVDYGFRWFVAITLPAWEEGFSEREDPVGWPSVRRISPRRFGWDPLAIEWEEKRYAYHKTIEDKDDLLDRAEQFPEEGWIVENLEGLTPQSGVEDIRNEPAKGMVPERDEVTIYHVWVPEYFPDNEDIRFHGREAWERKGVRGAWLTLGMGQNPDGSEKGEWLRRPYPYWGPRKGPYTMCGTYTIPDETGPLGVIPSVHAQTEERNKHARVLSKAMAVHKKGILVDATDPNWETRIRDFEDHWVVALEGLDEIDKKVKEVELGGATELHITHDAILKARVERASGITEAMQGRPRADITATAEATAADNASIRVAWQVHKFRNDGIIDILENVSWYMAREDIEVELGQEAEGAFINPETGEVLERVVYHGGPSEGEETIDEDFWDSLSYEIEAYSMERTSEALQQRRILELANMLGFLIPMMAQYPFVRWKDLIDFFSDAMNIPNLGDFFDMDLLAEFRAQMMQMQMDAGQGRPQGQPRTSRDVGPGLQPFGPMSAGPRPGVKGMGLQESPMAALMGNLSGANAAIGVR